MNREIKFRAWDNEYQMSKPFKISKLINFNDRTFRTLIDDEIIMQYTGLKDKNGVEIYEGDIMSKVSINELGNNLDYFYVVKWSSSHQGFRCYKYRLDENEHGLYWRKLPSDDSLVMVNTYNHVIGNIHENHELLK